MEELIKEGNYYIENKDYNNAIKCYLKCLEIKDNSYIKLKLSYLYLLLNDYETSCYYFINSYQIDSDYINIDYNLGLYLFSMLINLPDEYLDSVLNMTIEDIEILETDIGYQDIEFSNKIRNLLLNQSFTLVNDYITSNPDFTSNIFNLIIKELVTKIIKFKKEENKYLRNLIKNQSYQEIIDYLENSQKVRKLNEYLEYCLKLVKELINLKDNLESVDKINFKTNSVYKAIDCKDYERALQLEKNNCYKTKEDINSDILYLLLSKIVLELKVIKIINDEDIFDIDLGEIFEDNNSSLENNLDYELVFSNIVKYLNDNDLYQLYNEIDKLLNSINKVNYRFLIIDLIKLGDLDKVKELIKKLTLDIYEFSLGEYINYFYNSLVNKRYSETHIYLDIIKNAWRLGYDFTEVNVLEKILNRYDSNIDSSLTIKLSLTNKNNKL